MISRLAVRAASRSSRTFAVQSRNASISSIDVKYTGVATAIGSRASGTGKTGELKVKFGLPKEMGGAGNVGDSNPEQLFSLGYTACFLQAFSVCYKRDFPDKKPLPSDVNLKVKTSIGPPKGGEGFQIAVEIELLHSSVEKVLSKEEAQKVLEAAHEMCPYSKATRGNIEQHLALV